MYTWPYGTPIFLLTLYVGAQFSYEVRNWEIREGTTMMSCHRWLMKSSSLSIFLLLLFSWFTGSRDWNQMNNNLKMAKVEDFVSLWLSYNLCMAYTKCIDCKGWPVRLITSFCWHQIESSILVHGVSTVMQLMFWYEPKLVINLTVHPVDVHYEDIFFIVRNSSKSNTVETG